MNFVDNGWTGDVDWRVNCIKALIKAKDSTNDIRKKKKFANNIVIVQRMIDADKMLEFASPKKIQEFINAYRSLLEKKGLFEKLLYAKKQIHLKLLELEILKKNREGLLKPFLKGSDFLAAAEAFDKISKSNN